MPIRIVVPLPALMLPKFPGESVTVPAPLLRFTFAYCVALTGSVRGLLTLRLLLLFGEGGAATVGIENVVARR